MTMFALVSPGGSPGVTTAALALTLSWPSRVILAECDPSGGDVLAGLLGGHLPASTGLLPLALEAGAGTEVPGDTLWRQLIELDTEHSRLLLAGISDPRQSAALQSSLPWIAEALQGAAADVLADCGRLDSVAAVRPVLSAASLAVLVVRPTLRQLSRAVPRAEMLTSLVGRERVVALLAGAGGASDREAAKALGIPVAGHLADDARTAAVLSDGAGSRSRLQARPLLRSAAAAGRALRDSAAAAGPLPGADPVFSPYDDDLAVTGPVPGQPPGSRPAGGHPVPGPAAAGPPALRPAAFGHPAAGSPVLPGQLESGPPLLGQAGSGPAGVSLPPGPPGSGQPPPDWPGLAGAGVSGAGPPARQDPGPARASGPPAAYSRSAGHAGPGRRVAEAGAAGPAGRDRRLAEAGAAGRAGRGRGLAQHGSAGRARPGRGVAEAGSARRARCGPGLAEAGAAGRAGPGPGLARAGLARGCLAGRALVRLGLVRVGRTARRAPGRRHRPRPRPR